MQLDFKSVPVRFDFDIRKIYFKEDSHWEDFYHYKEKYVDNDF